MAENNDFTREDLELSADIVRLILRQIATDISFLQKSVYSLKLQPTGNVSSICADYENLYYNPKWVIGMYSKASYKLMKSVVHSILHSLYLHPSMTSEQDKVFDTAADFAVFSMMSSAGLLNSSISASIYDFCTKNSASSTGDLYELAQKDVKAFTKMYSIVSKLKDDDHSMWYYRQEKNPSEDGDGGTGDAENVQVEVKVQEDVWKRLLQEAKVGAKNSFGSIHGNMFVEIKKPDRFSRFSYLEYIRRFALQEIVSEDPDTLDMMMYTWGMDNLGDIPIVEFSEVREQCTATDIIIAIDMSGSCGGDVAANFLRQIYSLFEQMNIRSAVNIHVVTFDTRIISSKVIHSRSDADELLNNYEGTGWGGTDFRCVFDYADSFSQKSSGRKLKGLFFFSDAQGSFPDKKPPYLTTFFIPEQEDMFFFEGCIPEWVELVHYKD